MLEYKHYSFDLWLTLIKSNPDFKKERTKFFYDNFNRQKKSLEDVSVIFRNVDIMCNNINERTGKNIDAEEMYLMVISMMCDYSYPFKNINLNNLYQEMEDLLFKHRPIEYSSQTPNVLRYLKEKDDCTISILSNTGFIKGVTLRRVLREVNFDSFFDFQLYSDETGLSKPNKAFFQLMLENISKIENRAQINLHEIIHVGDNPIADIEGARSVGIHSLLINSNNNPIFSLIN